MIHLFPRFKYYVREFHSRAAQKTLLTLGFYTERDIYIQYNDRKETDKK